MNTIVKKHITKPIELEIKGITLLPYQDYVLYQDNIPRVELRYPDETEWWLQKDYSDNPEEVFTADECRCWIRSPYSYFQIRPVLRISKSSNFKIKDTFDFKDKTWTVISDNLAICNDFIGIGQYCGDKEKENLGDYKTSDVKKYIENWFNEVDAERHD